MSLEALLVVPLGFAVAIWLNNISKSGYRSWMHPIWEAS